MKVLITNHEVLIDEEDFPLLSRFNWVIKPDKHGFYVRAAVWFAGKKHNVLMHRLIMGMERHEVDHINRNGLDNRKENLRYCIKGRNAWNRVHPNETGFKGVGFRARRNRYIARIMHEGIREEIGSFKTPEEAARAYDKRARELHGEFAALNFKDQE